MYFKSNNYLLYFEEREKMCRKKLNVLVQNLRKLYLVLKIWSKEVLSDYFDDIIIIIIIERGDYFEYNSKLLLNSNN